VPVVNHKTILYLAALLGMIVSAAAQTAIVSAQSKPGDGIFTPIISPVAAIDKTNRPMTVEADRPEPNFADAMVAGKPTGDSYVIHFPTGDAGGACLYSGTGRYFIESTGTLTFQIIAQCGNLKRGYSYMICKVDEELRCHEAPWWYFRGRTYSITSQGVVVNGSALYPWKDPSEAPRKIQAMAASIKQMNERFANLKDPHVLHTRLISCWNFQPESKSYGIHEIATECAVKSLCNGIPNVDSLRDGDPIDWSTPVGKFIKQEKKISDVSHWVCFMRTQ
jgi:hypothetical protein